MARYKRFMKKVETPAQVIDALGGTRAVATLLKEHYPTVWIWRERGFPATHYKLFSRILSKYRVTAPASLWGQRELPTDK
jgi:hypothetical protein